jgi:hypothetical protein
MKEETFVFKIQGAFHDASTITIYHGCFSMCNYRGVKIYFTTLVSSTEVGFHEGRRQFTYKVLIFTRE